ncbi:hypothetical protein ILUMI_17330 [Ignelater luminosus]|uniref:1-acyl-sn-glycerol-3-phosphate acyltransferase n=1 Tax=Ignelater luminosus TaxID=2038154 RepID=A0A8K0CQN2_IGNLU|nr:hypothetical protein ILUMI_17330 [Ignelater luminosus]
MGILMWTALITVMLAILWNVSSVARYYLKFSLFILLSLIFATVPIPIMLLRPKSSKNALIPARALRMSAWILGLNYKVKGKENIVENSGCVVLINHQSALDLIVLAELWPIMDDCTVISKKEVFYLWPFGLATWLWGTIFIDRLNAEKAQESVNKTGKTIRDRKARVLMFPEGTRSLKDRLLPFKKGAFHLAIASQCPIQPVVVDRYKFLGKHRFDQGDITISILPAISTEGKTRDDIPLLMEKAYTTMSTFLEERSTTVAKKVD